MNRRKHVAYSPTPLIFQLHCPISNAIFASATAIRPFFSFSAAVSWQDTGPSTNSLASTCIVLQLVRMARSLRLASNGRVEYSRMPGCYLYHGYISLKIQIEPVTFINQLVPFHVLSQPWFSTSRSVPCAPENQSVIVGPKATQAPDLHPNPSNRPACSRSQPQPSVTIIQPLIFTSSSTKSTGQ